MAYRVDYIEGEDFLSAWPQRIKNALSVLFKRAAKPSDSDMLAVDRVKIEYANGSYHCCHYHAPQSNRVVFVLGGRRSKGRGNAHIFRTMKDAGISVVFAELPDPVKTRDYMSAVQEMSRHFLLESPFLDFYKDRECYLFGHSTGAEVILENLHNEDSASQILSYFHGIRPIGTFLRASFKNSAILNWLYEWHAGKNADVIYGDTLGDRVFAAINKLKGEEHPYEPEEIADSTLPYHWENIYMANEIEKRRNKLMMSSFPEIVLSSDKIAFLHGENDNIADMEAVQKMAKHMNAPLTIMKDTFHNPYTVERVNAVLYHLFNGVAKPQIVETPRQSRLHTLGQYARTLASMPHSMLHNLRGNTGTGQTPHRVRLPLPRFLIGK